MDKYALPERLLIGYYGDDFTGSTDVMEALTRNGLRTVLFLAPPTPEQLAQYEGLRAVGIAGISRSLPTEEMDAELRPAFMALRDLGVPIVHYKICSTFDSSPQIGSIGRAIEIGQEVCKSPFVPLVVGAPYLNRFVVFGNLFARSGPESAVYRLDRHPTMSRHPVTPMHESELRLILDEQMSQTQGGYFQCPNILSLESDRFALDDQRQVVIFDTLTEAHLVRIGQIIWRALGDDKQIFSASSSGLEYALAAYWREQNLLPEPPQFPIESVSQIVGVSGSCSPVAARQLEYARVNGFSVIDLVPDPNALEPLGNTETRDEIVKSAVEKLQMSDCRGVLLNTCAGPDDPRLTAHADNPRLQTSEYKRSIGKALGQILRGILETTDIRRVVVAGGDTSGYVAKELGIVALEMVCPMAPGSPLCQATTPDTRYDNMEIVFKGGQVGRQEFYTDVVNGGIP
jgi:3-oxoisoapionate kinase